MSRWTRRLALKEPIPPPPCNDVDTSSLNFLYFRLLNDIAQTKGRFWMNRDAPLEIGEGYDRLDDQDFCYDDGCGRLAQLWEQTAAGPVIE
jgi:hypothetical protein